MCTALLTVVLQLAEYVSLSVVFVAGPFSSRPADTYHVPGSVTLVFPAYSVESGLRRHLSQSVQFEAVVFSGLVSDSLQLQLAVVPECDAVPFLLPALEYSQCAVGKILPP